MKKRNNRPPLYYRIWRRVTWFTVLPAAESWVYILSLAWAVGSLAHYILTGDLDFTTKLFFAYPVRVSHNRLELVAPLVWGIGFAVFLGVHLWAVKNHGKSNFAMALVYGTWGLLWIWLARARWYPWVGVDDLVLVPLARALGSLF